MTQIGFVGLGIMGKPMAKNLLAKGCSVAIPSSSKAAAELVELGATAMDQKKIGRECAVIFMSLPNGDICKDVLFGENGIATEIRPGTLVVDTSSITPAQAQYCAKKLREKECPRGYPTNPYVFILFECVLIILLMVGRFKSTDIVVRWLCLFISRPCTACTCRRAEGGS